MIRRASSWYSPSVVSRPSPISGIRSPSIPSRQMNLSRSVTSMKRFASGPSIQTPARWNVRSVKTGP